jgi:hypothetical protein
MGTTNDAATPGPAAAHDPGRRVLVTLAAPHAELCQHRRTGQILGFVRPGVAMALAGVLAAACPTVRGTLAATTVDRSRTGTASIEQPASSAPDWSSSSGPGAPASVKRGQDTSPVGIGWG